MDDEISSDAERQLCSQLDMAAISSHSVAAAQCLQLHAIHKAVVMARRHPEIYVAASPSQTRVDIVRFAERSVVLDLALRLSIPENTIWAQFHEADALITLLPRMWSAFRAGTVCYANVRTAVAAIGGLPEADRILDELDTALVEKATRLTPSKFRTAARAIRERLHPIDAAERHTAARVSRRTEIEPVDDGMAWFHLYTDAPTIMKIDARLGAAATRQRNAPDETRTIAQLRADAAGDLLTGVGTKAEVRAHVHVTVPATALLNDPGLLTQAQTSPAVLDGYGPIDPASARGLVADSPSFRRIFTDPISGIDLAMDRRTYRPTAAQREWLRRKYQTCIAPTCAVPAASSDIDHTTDWQFDGVTNDDNLAPLSRGHHTLKHKTRITVTRRPDGRHVWTTPTGFSRTSDPPPF